MITGTVTFALRPVNLFASLLLLRWLRPEDFGAVALAMILFQTSNLFTSMGMDAALIHTKLDKNKAAFHAFVMMMTLSLLLFGLVYFNLDRLAPLLTKPENVASLLPILKALSFFIILMTASVVPVSLLKKELQFGRVSTLSMVQQLTYIMIALILAILGYRVWSLVIARLVSVSLKTILAFFFVRDWGWLKPQKWEKDIVTGLFSYGRHSMVNGFISYLHSHWDDWLVGRVLGEAALGFYSKSYDLTNNTIKQLSDNVIGAVFFPSYTKMQENKTRLRRVYIKSVQLVSFIVAPLAFGIFVIARETVPILWGPKWAPMIPLLQIYTIMLLARPISTNSVPLFLAMGKPNYNSRAGYVLLGVMGIFVLILFPQGVLGVATAVVISHIVGAAYNIYQVNTLLPGSGIRTIKAFLPNYMAGLVMAIVIYSIKGTIWAAVEGMSGFIGLGILISIGGVVFLPLGYLTQKALFQEIWQIVIPILGKRFPFINRTVMSKI